MAKIDRRFIRSENQFVNALVSLLNKRDLIDISIADLVKQADLNKSTFYLHYTNIEQVLSSLQDRLISQIFTLFQESSGDLDTFSLSLLDVVKKSKRVFRTVLSQSNSALVENLYMTFFGLYKQTNGKKMDIDVYRKFAMLNGLISTVRLWCQDSCVSSKEELSKFIVEQISSNN
ncbi:MAG: hypothetical protein MJ241_04470 [Bacilli bacterium]|nr:hypothetical protein [Bacilli bacterium]